MKTWEIQHHRALMSEDELNQYSKEQGLSLKFILDSGHPHGRYSYYFQREETAETVLEEKTVPKKTK